MKVWDRAGIELATPGYAVRRASVVRHVTDCATRPGSSGCTVALCVIYLVLWHSKIYDLVHVFAPSEVSNQPAHSRSLFRSFAKRYMGSQGPYEYPYGQR